MDAVSVSVVPNVPNIDKSRRPLRSAKEIGLDSLTEREEQGATGQNSAVSYKKM